MDRDRFAAPEWSASSLGNGRTLLLLLILLATCGFSRGSAPGPEGADRECSPAAAYIQMLALHPAEPEVLYAATRGAGFFRRDHPGSPWRQIAPVSEKKHYNAVMADPTRPGHILVGGEQTGLWLSRDRGDHWTELGPLAPGSMERGHTILDLAMGPGDRLLVLTPEGIYLNESYENPMTWEWVFDYPAWLEQNRQLDWPEEDWQMIRFQKLSIDPHRPDTLLLGARWEGGTIAVTMAGPHGAIRISPVFSGGQTSCTSTLLSRSAFMPSPITRPSFGPKTGECPGMPPGGV